MVAVLTLAGCAEPPKASPPPPADTRAADEAAIHAAVKEWSASAQAKDADKFASFYAEDAVILLEDAPDISGKAAIREALGGMMQDPNFSLTFEPTKVVAARSGDLAYETGTYALTLSDPKKKASTEKGHYVVVWQKGADGTWKVARDVPVSDPPEAAAKK
jgi:uncharacterized protein (TIGR02246 family)